VEPSDQPWFQGMWSVYTCVCMCVHTCTHVCASIHMLEFSTITAKPGMCVGMWGCVYVCLGVCVHVSVPCVCVCVHVLASYPGLLPRH